MSCGLAVLIWHWLRKGIVRNFAGNCCEAPAGARLGCGGFPGFFLLVDDQAEWAVSFQTGKI